MKKEFCFVLLSVLMFSLVAGAGYNIVVPSAGGGDNGGSSGGGGGGAAANITVNETANGTTEGDVDADGLDDEGSVVDKITDVPGAIADFAKSIGWRIIVSMLVSLAVIGGIIWYFLKDGRKNFVEIRAKKTDVESK